MFFLRMFSCVFSCFTGTNEPRVAKGALTPPPNILHTISLIRSSYTYTDMAANLEKSFCFGCCILVTFCHFAYMSETQKLANALCCSNLNLNRLQTDPCDS